MPVYTYRREDGSTFDFRQSFNDSPLTVDPETGQKVVRVVQNAGVIFKGSGFYINDSKGSKQSAKSASKANGNGKTEGTSDKADSSAKTDAPAAESKSKSGTEAKATPAASD